MVILSVNPVVLESSRVEGRGRILIVGGSAQTGSCSMRKSQTLSTASVRASRSQPLQSETVDRGGSLHHGRRRRGGEKDDKPRSRFLR